MLSGCVNTIIEKKVERSLNSYSKAREDMAKKMYVPVTPEVWNGVSSVAVFPPTARCVTSSTFAESLSTTLRNWSVADHFQKSLVVALRERAPFKVIQSKRGDPGPRDPASAKMPIDKMICPLLQLYFEGDNPRIAIVASWMIHSPGTFDRKSMTALTEESQKEFQPLSRNITAAIPKHLGGIRVMRSAYRAQSEWLAQDGALARKEMARMLEELARAAAADLLPKGPAEAKSTSGKKQQ
jgi:hypothetical protein